ncbi:hypothetical protein K7432_014716, partial [Basidiobolus ranarum]
PLLPLIQLKKPLHIQSIRNLLDPPNLLHIKLPKNTNIVHQRNQPSQANRRMNQSRLMN